MHAAAIRNGDVGRNRARNDRCVSVSMGGRIKSGHGQSADGGNLWHEPSHRNRCVGTSYRAAAVGVNA
jgi:hypothetical protein